jgi:hypothetical protein
MIIRFKALAVPSFLLMAWGCSGATEDEDELMADIGVARAGLRKGTPGARVGDGNYCDNPAAPCSAGEGDCDGSGSCEAGLLCGAGKLKQFGFTAGDACVPAHCVNKQRDADETQIDCGGSCGTVCATPVCRPNGTNGRCNSDCLCQAGEGDCDSSSECAEGLVCGGKLSQFGFSEGNACVLPHCLNKLRDADETQIDCGGSCGTVCAIPVCRPNGTNGRCNSDCLCQAGEGDCDSSSECAEGLVCGGKLSQFGFSEGNACVLPHCLNKVRDGNETQVDCGGDCGSVKCPEPPSDCTSSSLYDIAVNSAATEKWPVSGYGSCTSWDASYQTQLEAVVTGATVEVTGWGFAGSYPIVERTATGFVAEIGDPLGGMGVVCGNAYPGGVDRIEGWVAMKFDCSGHVTFNATCLSDASADGCYPNYTETATGRGTRSLSCTTGYAVSERACVDIDECANSPCTPAETCINTPGTFTCSCQAPSVTCGGECVSTETDFDNCGACDSPCGSAETCSEGVCVALTCPSGFMAQRGVCVDIDECAANPCVENSTCTNYWGGYSCACASGYVASGGACVDIDECATTDCASGETCVNLPGSYVCSCEAPFQRCGSLCVNIASDAHNCGACGLGCVANQACENGMCIDRPCAVHPGPSMVRVLEGYCIDSTEVTEAQYAAWLDTGPSTAVQDTTCGWNSSYVPSCTSTPGYWPPSNAANRPVVCVDWCDAAAYCRDSGKHLCGNPAGGPVDFWEGFVRVAGSQWYNACTSHEKFAFPYGNNWQPLTCNVARGLRVSEDVGTQPLCQSPLPGYAGIYDLSGNVGEWEDSCLGVTCRVRGGSFVNTIAQCAGGEMGRRDSTATDRGFRCCAD